MTIHLAIHLTSIQVLHALSLTYPESNFGFKLTLKDAGEVVVDEAGNLGEGWGAPDF